MLNDFSQMVSERLFAEFPHLRDLQESPSEWGELLIVERKENPEETLYIDCEINDLELYWCGCLAQFPTLGHPSDVRPVEDMIEFLKEIYADRITAGVVTNDRGAFVRGTLLDDRGFGHDCQIRPGETLTLRRWSGLVARVVAGPVVPG